MVRNISTIRAAIGSDAFFLGIHQQITQHNTSAPGPGPYYKLDIYVGIVHHLATIRSILCVFIVINNVSSMSRTNSILIAIFIIYIYEGHMRF